MITVTTSDTGRRVRDAEGNEGAITKVIPADGEAPAVVYVKYAYQMPQDAPYPTNGRHLEWVEDEKLDASDIPELGEEFFKRARRGGVTTLEEGDDEDGLVPLGVAVGETVEVISEAMDSANSAASEDFSGQGGDFGGGGASGDF